MKNRIGSSELADAPGKYMWAEYLGCMEGIPDESPQSNAGRAETPVLTWGLAVCLLVTLGAMAVSALPVWPFTVQDGRHPLEPMMIAIILGMLLGNCLTLPKWFRPGIRFSYHKLLSLGIILLGVRLNFFDVLR